MAHVVAEPCLGCKFADCVVVCPTNCFREGRKMLYIHPDECIDCEACVPECPKDAIFQEDKLPEEWIPFKDLNATMARQSATIAVNSRSGMRFRSQLCGPTEGLLR